MPKYKKSATTSDAAKKSHEYTFSKKVEMSVEKAKQKIKEDKDKPLTHSKRRAASTFVQKLYRDEDDLNDLKVLAGEDNFDSDIEDKEQGIKERKRESKLASKQGKGGVLASKVLTTTKVGKLKLEKGSVAMFAVNEVYPGQYAIVNHTRNVKGFINLKDQDWSLKPGQLVIGSILARGTADYQAETSGHQNRKLQLSLEPKLLNRGLTAETITTGMILQGAVESKETKGYMIDLGIKDKAKAFVKFDKKASNSDEKEVGDLVHVIVQGKTSKVIKCSFVSLDKTDEDDTEKLQQVKTDLAQVTPHTLKPGFLVSAKVQKLYSNGVEVTFLGGMTGTIFADHLAKGNVTKYKMGEKLQALVISQDIASKATALTALPSLLKLQRQESLCTVGQLYSQVKVEKKIFGNSYLIRLDNSPLLGLLHKTQIPAPDDVVMNAEDGDQDDEETKDPSSDEAKKRAMKKAKHAKRQRKEKDSSKIVNDDKDDLLDIGQVLPEVRVKEFNFFDGKPILSMKMDIVKSSSLDYKSLAIGECMTGTIESVNANDAQKHIVLKLGDFVKGTLSLDHMADHPLKVIPPKFTQVGKEIKVRIFNVEGRNVQLTKKDSLMKDSVAVYTSLNDLRPGMKLQGLVVGKTEYGYVVKSFAGLKGLIKHDDFKENGMKKLKTSDLKPGTAIKAYVLFVKKGSGIALTLSKKKAKKNQKDDSDADESLSSKYLPEIESVIETYANLITTGKKSSAPPSVLDVIKYKVCESRANFYIVKSLSSKKPTVAVLPRCLSSSFGIALPFEDKDFSFEAMTIGVYSGEGDTGSLAIVCAKPELIALKEEFVYSESARSMVALVESVNAQTGITLRFSNNGVTKLVALRDIAQAEKVCENYQVGQVVRATHNTKSGRLTLKRTSVDQMDSQCGRRDQTALIGAIDKITTQALDRGDSGDSLSIGQKVQAKVQLVKDYGLILDIVGSASTMTGFIVNEQKLNTEKTYKVGEVISDCVVLDIDFEKKIVDLSERLVSNEESKKAKKKDAKQEGFQKAVVELNKEKYLVVSLKADRSRVGLCVLHNLSAESHSAYQSYGIGDEIDVKVVPSKLAAKPSEGRFILTQPRLVQTVSSSGLSASQLSQNMIEEGEKVVGTVKSIKGMCAFIQVGSNGKVPIIGRLHAVESAPKDSNFKTLKPGDKIEAKILRKSTEKGRTMIELTRRSEHMKADGLDQSIKHLLSLDTIRNGQQIEGLITDVVSQDIATKVSCPVQVQISAFVRSQLLFSDILDPQAIQAEKIPSIADFITKRFKMGQRISLTYLNGRFICQDEASQAGTTTGKKSYERGNLVVVRFVKVVQGFGVTVQLDSKTFGVIELSELTDDITQNVSLEAQKRGIFIARVIDVDKKGRLQLSARESVLSYDFWRLIQPEGTSGKFLTHDQKRQQNANMRNKVLKYGAALTFKQGDLTLGYVTNISKAGCFVQVAHNVTMRAGLNELSDEQDYDFLAQLPIGRVVLARITKATQSNTRFDCSLRKSLIVYGVHQVAKSDLKPQTRLSCLILAISADGVAFGQVKGSYHKLKIKETPESASPGQLCQVEIAKITSDKISGTFIEFDDDSFDREGAEKERHYATIYASVQEEASSDIAAAKKQKQSTNAKPSEEPDIEQLVENKRKQTILEEQIRDLQQLGGDAADSDDDEVMADPDEDDSDAEEIARLKQIEQQQENEYESSDNEDDEEKGGEDEEMSEDDDDSVQEIPDSNSSSDGEGDDDDDDEEEDASKKPSKSGKKALRAQLELEKSIRAKEAEMRSKDGAVPKTVNDFERMLVSDYDQSYLWIQYMAFMLENLDAEAARRVAERAVKQVSMTAEDDKLNLWIAFMNLESKFGSTEQLQAVVKRALEVNDRKKVYLQLINIYRTSDKVDFVEDIYKKLCKKYHESLEIWSSYIEFLFEMRGKEGQDQEQSFTEPKTILQRALQALPKASHVNVISKFGMLEYKYGRPEHGRTMFEGIVTNYPKRMDIWSIYMDMEVKYGGGKANQAQARHLFERCLSLPEISKKPKKMKLTFRKYMEFENALGNQNKLAELRQRVEQYLETAFKAEGDSGDSESEKEAEKAAEESGSGSAAEEQQDGESSEGEGDDDEEGEDEEMEESSDE